MKALLTKILVLTAVAVFSSPAFVQAQDDRVVVTTGKYRFTQGDINRVTEIYEWMFAGTFTAAQRRRFQTLLGEDAQSNEQTAEGIASMLQSYPKIKAATPDKEQQFRREVVPGLIAALEKEKSEINGILLEMYRNGQGETANADLPADDTQTDEPRNAGGAVRLADLAGTWSTSAGSTERYKSLITGELSAPSGHLIEYEFSPNGTVKYASFYSNTFYSCTVQMFVYKHGRARIDGSNITIDYAPGSRTNVPCAAAKREATIPAERKTSGFRIERDEYGVKLCLVEDGAEVCLRKVK